MKFFFESYTSNDYPLKVAVQCTDSYRLQALRFIRFASYNDKGTR